MFTTEVMGLHLTLSPIDKLGPAVCISKVSGLVSQKKEKKKKIDSLYLEFVPIKQLINFMNLFQVFHLLSFGVAHLHQLHSMNKTKNKMYINS